MIHWIIEDWMSKRIFPDKTFNSFEEARSFITEHANATAKDEGEFDGICEDLYAVEVMDPLDTLTIETADEARNYAIHWQHWFSEQRASWGDVADWGSAFEKLAERFPELTDEFRENAIITVQGEE